MISRTGFFVFICLFSSFLFPSSSLLARSIYLNDENIDGVVLQTIENATGKIDKDGNIWIKAKGYQVKNIPSVKKGETHTENKTLPSKNAQSSAPEKINVHETESDKTTTKKYWLVSKKSNPGKDQYEIEVWLNGTFIRTIAVDDEKQIEMDVTDKVKLGSNKVHIIATLKIPHGEKKKSSLARDFTQIIVGEGEQVGKNLVISQIVVDYKRSANHTEKDYSDSFEFVAK